MIRFIWLTVILGLCLTSWTASWADMEEVMMVLTSEIQEKFGNRVVNVGDLNKDGYDDLIVGAYTNSVPERSYIYFGGPTFDSIPDVKLTIEAPSFDTESPAGDVNGDGFDDFMVYTTPINKESVHLYFGGDPIDTLPDVKLYGETEREAFGWTLSPAGDLNDDGYDDVLIGAYMASYSGKAYIFFGGNPMDTIPDIILKAGSDKAFGMGVSGLGDVNADGYPDIAVGDPWKASSRGAVYVYFGGPDADKDPDLILWGEDAYSHFGIFIDGGDLNGDSYNDIVVGAMTYGNGKIYIYAGGPSLDDEADLSMYGRLSDDALGDCISVVGDLDEDGYNDLVTWTEKFIGRVYAYYGGKRMDRDIDLVLPDARGGPYYYGFSFDAIDVNGDGHRELCVGSPHNENKVYVYQIIHDQFVISLKPDTRKVVKGDMVGFLATITNNTPDDRSLYFWVDLLDPNAIHYNKAPVLGPKLKTIPAWKTVSRHLSIEIPGDPELGQYTCTLKADTTEPGWPYLDFIENDSFEFKLVNN